MKITVIKPPFKKEKKSLDAAIINNYRTTSTLPLMNKILEEVVLQHLNDVLASTSCYENFQLELKPLHSIQSPIKMLIDIRLNKDSGKMSILMLCSKIVNRLENFPAQS